MLTSPIQANYARTETQKSKILISARLCQIFFYLLLSFLAASPAALSQEQLPAIKFYDFASSSSSSSSSSSKSSSSSSKSSSSSSSSSSKSSSSSSSSNSATSTAYKFLTQKKKARQTINDFAMWMPVQVNLPLFNERIRLYAESQERIERTSQSMFTMAQLRLRGALGYRISKGWAVYSGYTWAPNFHPYRGENRPYQDLVFGNVLFKKLQMQYRYRSEERFIEHVKGMSYRGRFKIRGALPIRDTRYYLIGEDEMFITFNECTNGPRRGLDQFRTYAGIGRQCGLHVRVETGYLMRYNLQKGSTPDQIDHALMSRVVVNY